MGWILDLEETFDGTATVRGADFGNWTQYQFFGEKSLKRSGAGKLVADTPDGFASWLQKVGTVALRYKVSAQFAPWDTTNALNEHIISSRSLLTDAPGGMRNGYNARILTSELRLKIGNTETTNVAYSSAFANGDTPFATIETEPGTTGTTTVRVKTWKGTWADEATPLATLTVSNDSTGPQTVGTVGLAHFGSARVSPGWGIETIRGYVWVDDFVPPTITGLEILPSGAVLRATFSEAILPASAVTPLTLSGFALGAVTASAGTRTTTTTVEYPLSRNVSGAAYENGVGAYTTGNITDLANPPNSLAAASGISITNNSTQVPLPSVVISPTTATINVGASQQFVGTSRYGTLPDTTVWGVAGSGNGSVTANGLYTAPSTPGTYTVRATRTNHPSVFTEATITVTDPSIVAARKFPYAFPVQQSAFATSNNPTGTGLASTLELVLRDLASSAAGTVLTVYNATITERYPGLYEVRLLSPDDLSCAVAYIRDPVSGIVASIEMAQIPSNALVSRIAAIVGVGLDPGPDTGWTETRTGNVITRRYPIPGGGTVVHTITVSSSGQSVAVTYEQ